MTTETISGTSMQAPSQLFSPFPFGLSSRQVLPGATRQGHAMQRPKDQTDLSLSGFLLSPPHWQDPSSSSGSTQDFGFSSTSNASSSFGEGVSSMESKLLSSSQMQSSFSSSLSSSASAASAASASASSKPKSKSKSKSTLPSSEAGMTGVSSMESKLLSSSQMQSSFSSSLSSSASAASAASASASSKPKSKSKSKSTLPSSEAGMTIDIANLKVSGTVTDILINQSFPAHLFTSYLPHFTESVEFSRFCWIPPPCLIIWYRNRSC
jgi:hypothetical protein